MQTVFSPQVAVSTQPIPDGQLHGAPMVQNVAPGKKALAQTVPLGQACVESQNWPTCFELPTSPIAPQPITAVMSAGVDRSIVTAMSVGDGVLPHPASKASHATQASVRMAPIVENGRSAVKNTAR